MLLQDHIEPLEQVLKLVIMIQVRVQQLLLLQERHQLFIE